MYASEAYRAAGKASKPPWAIGLGIGVAIQLVGSRVVLTGIRPTIAAAMSEYGFSPRPGLRIVSTLEAAVETTLANLRTRS